MEREPVYEQTAEKSGLDDIGGTYVEIDYTKQHLWYYKEGKLITETDIVSGNIARKNGSPDGVFKIVYKQKDATLVGENYASNVKYFMPFAYNVGIHDAGAARLVEKSIRLPDLTDASMSRRRLLRSFTIRLRSVHRLLLSIVIRLR